LILVKAISNKQKKGKTARQEKKKDSERKRDRKIGERKQVADRSQGFLYAKQKLPGEKKRGKKT